MVADHHRSLTVGPQKNGKPINVDLFAILGKQIVHNQSPKIVKVQQFQKISHKNVQIEEENKINEVANKDIIEIYEPAIMKTLKNMMEVRRTSSHNR